MKSKKPTLKLSFGGKACTRNWQRTFGGTFGGSLEGNHVQNVLDDAEKGDFIILEALKDKPEIIEKYKEEF